MFLHKDLWMTVGRAGVKIMFGVSQECNRMQNVGLYRMEVPLRLPLHLLADGWHSHLIRNYTVLILTTRRPMANIYTCYFIYERHIISLECISVNVFSVPFFEVLEKD